MKTWRFRTNLFGKLILQRCSAYSYVTCCEVSSSGGTWRDATARDLLIYYDEILKEKSL